MERMDRALASEIIEAIWMLNKSFDRLTTLGIGIADTREREAFMRSLGALMDATHNKLLAPILRHYPELER
jgi:hypothetical protein